MIAVIMVPMIRHLYTAAGKTAKLITVVNIVYLALLAIILVCWMGIYTFILHSNYADNYGYFDLVQHNSRLAVAYPAMTAFAILMAGAIMLFLLARNSSLGRWVSYPAKSLLFPPRLSTYSRIQNVKAQVLFLIVAALGMTLTHMASNADLIFGSHGAKYLAKSANATLFIELFFYSCTFFAAFSIAASPHLSDANPAYPPVGTAMPPQQYATYDNPPVVPELYSRKP